MKDRKKILKEISDQINNLIILEQQIIDANNNGRHDIAQGKNADLICVLGAVITRLNLTIDRSKMLFIKTDANNV